MNIRTIKRPWIKSYNKKKVETWYQSPQWKHTRALFREGTTFVDGIHLSNKYCILCFKEKGIFVPGPHCDHKQAIEDGGSRTDHNNLQSLCESHHNSKSAREGNNRRRK